MVASIGRDQAVLSEGSTVTVLVENPLSLSRSGSRLGWSSGSRVASGLVATVAATATVLAAAAQPAGAVTPPKTVTCEYVLHTWPGAFVADILIVNTGTTIKGWTVHWTFDTPSKITSVWSATITDGANGVYATNAVQNAVIPQGQTREFGWTALAETTSIPTDLTINGQPC